MTKPLFRRVNLGALTLTIACSGLSAFGQDQAEPAKPAQDAEQTPDKEAAKLVFVEMTTSKGDIILELDRGRAPVSVKNFLGYVNDGFYKGTIFHRVMDGFMIQGGGFAQDMKRKETKSPIANEWQNGLKNDIGTIAMARTSDPNSATSQFFINVNNNASLTPPPGRGVGYAVFGKVVAGMDVVNAIKATQTTTKNGMQNVPVTPITIDKTTVISAEDAKKLMSGTKTKAPQQEG
jgi:peptidyl-prolyl cis-trans isomerase A (cyclophilin A)